jgi:DNA-binding NtrC family response regulator
MTPFELDRVARTLDSLNQFPEACRRRGVVVAAADPETRHEVARCLVEHEHDVWTAGSAGAAIQICSDHAGDIDVLVTGDELDSMPVPDLYGCLKTRLPWLQCCVLTRCPERAAVAAATRMGAMVVTVR